MTTKKYPSKGLGLEELTGICMREGCDRPVIAHVMPGTKMPRKFCSNCKARHTDYHNEGLSQGAATIHSQNRY